MIANTREKFVFIKCPFAALKPFLDLGRGFAVEMVILLPAQNSQRLPAIRKSPGFGRDNMAIPIPSDLRDQDQPGIL